MSELAAMFSCGIVVGIILGICVAKIIDSL